MKKERSVSGAIFDFPSSPNTSRKHKDKHSSSSSRARFMPSNMAQLVDLTIFHIPGLDVKVKKKEKKIETIS
jgi:hypothetical protein